MKKLLLFFAACVPLIAVAQNVGLGTSSPQFPLDVRTTDNGVIMRLRTAKDSTGASTILRFTTASNLVTLGDKSSFIGDLRSGAGHNLLFGTSANGAGMLERMRLSYDGMLGVGTDNPSGRLHIDMSNTASDNAIIINDDEDAQVELQRNNIPLGFWNLTGNDVKMGTTAGNNTGNLVLRTNGGDRLQVSPSGDVRIGDLSQFYLRFSDNTMQSFNNGVAADLILQASGGKLKIGNFTDAATTKMQVNGGSDAGLGDANSGYLMLGLSTGLNIIADNNEVQARNNGAAANLYLQNGGGNIALGNITPTTQLHMTGDLTLQSSTPVIQLKDNAGTSIGFLNTSADDLQLGTNAGNTNGRLILRTNGGNRVYINSSGSVSIGTSTAATGYMLNVNGRAIVEELKVQLSGSWPDYVFTNGYKLQSFDELRKYIRDNKHLPNIPAAKELQTNGLEVGEMQRKMMEKIEELTLYILELETRITALQQKQNP